ncbi:16S rRNA (cytosine(1402)-N(4))-methyltransferase RsmH [Prochlorococcus marinus]|uniref:16S rRNA (cytosine(1402)-N(4))-methyltransferase RsmH n=1 Tax=Prochlorococcus marinus TaxID=1219 RepID=UPI0022B43302|nr:16S rRNA (cytosine(1402)-N(4))-methyltransferase RsmH [Prochlorococcus marinus]
MKEGPISSSSNFNHVPIMGKEIIQSLKELPSELTKQGLIIDATIGGGGHSAQILENFPGIKIIGIDQDPIAREAASKRLIKFGTRIEIISTNFADFSLNKQAICVLADLGVSSHQLDEPSRGFSFRLDGPVDMRMNPEKGLSAAELIDTLSEQDLANLIYNLGEEKRSRRIARKIKNDLAENGAYNGTQALSYAIAGCFPPKQRHGRIHPSTRTFQALRIAVNNELESLDSLLKKAPNWLLEDGLLMIMSFHSLEDRRVKSSFKTDNRLKILSKKPLRASPQEIELNPRSKSAKLRISAKKFLK